MLYRGTIAFDPPSRSDAGVQRSNRLHAEIHRVMWRIEWRSKNRDRINAYMRAWKAKRRLSVATSGSLG